jgi:hypothetical protein
LTLPVYRDAAPPPDRESLKLVLTPKAWKARLWRAFDDSTTALLRLDAPLNPRDVADLRLREAVTPFAAGLAKLDVYLERGASVPLPLAWSVGHAMIERDRAVVWLHRVLDDPFGLILATLFRGETKADLTLGVVAYEASRDRLTLAIRDYDLGLGADFH